MHVQVYFDVKMFCKVKMNVFSSLMRKNGIRAAVMGVFSLSKDSFSDFSNATSYFVCNTLLRYKNN